MKKIINKYNQYEIIIIVIIIIKLLNNKYINNINILVFNAYNTIMYLYIYVYNTPPTVSTMLLCIFQSEIKADKTSLDYFYGKNIK